MLEPNGRNWAFALDMPRSWTGDNSLRMGSDYQLGTFFGGPRARRLDYRVTSYVDYSAREPLTEREREVFRALPPEQQSARARAWPRAGSPIEPSGADDHRARDGVPALAAVSVHADAAGARRATRRRVPVRDARGLLRALRLGADRAAARRGPAGTRRHGLPRRRAQRASAATTSCGSPTRTRGPKCGSRTKAGSASTRVAAVAPERVALGLRRARQRRRGRSRGGAAHRAGAARPRCSGTPSKTRWQAWIIGYGPELQRALLESLGFDNLRRAQRSAVLLGLAVAATVALLLGLSLYLSWRQRRRAPQSTRQRCASRRSCGNLQRLEVPARAPSEGPRAYAERAADALAARSPRGFAASSSSICARATSPTPTAQRWRRSRPRSRRFAPRAPDAVRRPRRSTRAS